MLYSNCRAHEFHGRSDILVRIKQYIRSNYDVPLVIHGKAGEGKTYVLAKAAKEASHWLGR